MVRGLGIHGSSCKIGKDKVHGLGAVVHWICQLKSTDASMDDLHAKLGLSDIALQVCERRLRLYRHIMQSSREINRVRTRQISGKKGPAHV